MSGRDDGADTPEPPDTPSGGPKEPPAEPDPDEADEEWQFSLEDIEEREAEAAAEAEAEARQTEPVEAGDPTLEGVAFVVLGVLFTLFVLSRLLIG